MRFFDETELVPKIFSRANRSKEDVKGIHKDRNWVIPEFPQSVLSRSSSLGVQLCFTGFHIMRPLVFLCSHLFSATSFLSSVFRWLIISVPSKRIVHRILRKIYPIFKDNPFVVLLCTLRAWKLRNNVLLPFIRSAGRCVGGCPLYFLAENFLLEV